MNRSKKHPNIKNHIKPIHIHQYYYKDNKYIPSNRIQPKLINNSYDYKNYPYSNAIKEYSLISYIAAAIFALIAVAVFWVFVYIHLTK
jgi:hypothetical protein